MSTREKEEVVWTQELLEELDSQEDAITAYDNGYYDTHNLEYIGEHVEEYRSNMKHYKQFLPEPESHFWEYKVEDGNLVKKRE